MSSNCIAEAIKVVGYKSQSSLIITIKCLSFGPFTAVHTIDWASWRECHFGPHNTHPPTQSTFYIFPFFWPFIGSISFKKASPFCSASMFWKVFKRQQTYSISHYQCKNKKKKKLSHKPHKSVSLRPNNSHKQRPQKNTDTHTHTGHFAFCNSNWLDRKIAFCCSNPFQRCNDLRKWICPFHSLLYRLSLFFIHFLRPVFPYDSTQCRTLVSLTDHQQQSTEFTVKHSSTFREIWKKSSTNVTRVWTLLMSSNILTIQWMF